MANQEVPLIIGETGEVIGTAKILPPDDKGRTYASFEINPEKAEVFQDIVMKTTEQFHKQLEDKLDKLKKEQNQ